MKNKGTIRKERRKKKGKWAGNFAYHTSVSNHLEELFVFRRIEKHGRLTLLLLWPVTCLRHCSTDFANLNFLRCVKQACCLLCFYFLLLVSRNQPYQVVRFMDMRSFFPNRFLQFRERNSSHNAKYQASEFSYGFLTFFFFPPFISFLFREDWFLSTIAL